MALTIAKTRKELYAAAEPLRARGKVALVPTMGALHAGHKALIEAAAKEAHTVVVSIFVNPTQFGPNEDFSRYPRQLEADMRLCEQAGAHIVYAPSVEEIYPQGFATRISVRGISEMLEGAHRPGHFDGVATVVAKLFLQAMPDIAFFGEKDYQQLAVIRQLVRDLDMPVAIRGVPTVRDTDGLALSSRNAYLSLEERMVAGQINAILREAVSALEQGAPAKKALAEAGQKLLDAGVTKVDYIALCDAHTLDVLAAPTRPARLLAALLVGSTRLIDNFPVEANPL